MIRVTQFLKLILFLVGSVSFYSLKQTHALASTEKSQTQIRIGLVLDKGGVDDKSFNAAAYQGALKAQKELGISLKYVEAGEDTSFEPLLRGFAQKNFDLIISIGMSQVDAVKKIAAQFPHSFFSIIDGEVHASNVRSFLFKEHEGSYLVGVIAALKSNGAPIGFIGGVDMPLIRRFDWAYAAGARSIHPAIKVVSNYIGITPDSWSNPAKAKEIAISQYHSGVNVIFTASGASGLGVFDAAEEKKKWVIGVDSNQNGIKPGIVLTSMVKKIGKVVFNLCKDVQEKKFRAGIINQGLFENAVDYTLDVYNKELLKPFQKRIDRIKADIISGKIKVPDYYLERSLKTQ